MATEKPSTNPKEPSNETSPSENEVVYDPAGGQSLREFVEANRGKKILVGEDVPMKEYLEALPKGTKIEVIDEENPSKPTRGNSSKE